MGFGWAVEHDFRFQLLKALQNIWAQQNSLVYPVTTLKPHYLR